MNSNVLDLEEFMERVQNDKELLLELLDIYTADYTEKRKNLETALRENDMEQIVSIAHSLKGASGNISAKELRQLFLELEESGKTSGVSGADEILQALDAKYQALTAEIEVVKKELGGA